MPELPSGTVAFLFTDIEGSTKRWQRDARAMAAAVARHDTILRETVKHNGGAVFKTVGDAFCVTFPTAVQAVSVALDAQRSLTAEDWGRSARSASAWRSTSAPLKSVTTTISALP